MFSAKCMIFVSVITLITFVNLYAQSAEIGQVFNKYSEAENGVNIFSGAASLKKNLVTISSGKISTSLELNYSSNVHEIVKLKNDIAPSSFVGLGWSLGHAKILSEHSSTMWLDDDSYYFQTSAGVRYKIIKDSNGKYWIEGLPYWILKPIIKKVSFDKLSYSIIVGWEAIDDFGTKYSYGDMDYDSIAPTRNATEYTIANPYSNGIVGIIENAKDVCFPNAWNLKRMEDLDENFIEFSYKQFTEKVKYPFIKLNEEEPYVIVNGFVKLNTEIFNYTTRSAYTKEIYLKKIKSSNGSYAELKTELKDYDNEFIKPKGKVEGIDESIKPDVRRYLSQISVYGTDGKILRFIDFCYKPLNIVIDTAYNSEYVKRLLSSITQTAVNDNESIEVDKEIYVYYENELDSMNKLLPLGAIDSIKGNNCGSIKYEYKSISLSNADKETELHRDIVDLVGIAISVLDNGMPFLVGINKKKNKAEVYFRKNGTWLYYEELKTPEDKISDGEFIVGKNWLIFKNKKDDSDNYYPYVWNGKNWERQEGFVDKGSRDFFTVGNGYILTARVFDAKMELKIPWSIWGKTYKININDVDDDSDARKYISLITSENHFGVFFTDDNDGFNDGHLIIYSFDKDKEVKKSLDIDDLDDDNQYTFFDNNTIVAVTEGSGLFGYYAKAYHFRENGEPSWNRLDISSLDGVQGTSSIQAMGEKYFAVRHDDNDDMTIFERNKGGLWNISREHNNENMVHGQDLDWWEPAQWFGYSGYNFFVARKPRIRKRWWRNNEIKPDREYKLYSYKTGEWKEGKTVSSGDVKHIYPNNDWFIVKENRYAYIFDGIKWKLENLGELHNKKSSSFLVDADTDKIRALNGDYLVVENETDSYIYYKKGDSFRENFKSFFVSKKIINEPVTDKITTYNYNYNSTIINDNPFYDYASKSPIIEGYSIQLPENGGLIEKILCNITDSNNESIALGEICKENYYKQGGIYPVESIEREYERYRKKDWPLYLYQDLLKQQKSIAQNIKRKENYYYNDNLNGQVSSVIVNDENNQKNLFESRNIYALEKYTALKESNRLNEKLGEYKCIPNCSSGSIVSANVLTYSKDENNAYRVKDNWIYVPKGTKRESKLSFDWSKSSQSKNWTKTQKINKYNKEIVAETENALGIKNSTLYDVNNPYRAIANVEGASLDEFLVVTDKCSNKDWTCVQKSFLNSAIDNLTTTLLNYGRFSKNVIHINSTNIFKGSIKKAKKDIYRFSAWVQSTSLNGDDSLKVFVGNSINKSFALKGNNSWEYIEFETDSKLSESSYVLKIQTSNNSDIYLQDIRFVPENSMVTTTYWDEHLNLPIAQVDNRSVGQYTKYDASGRIVETYNETVDGDVVLASKNTYVKGVCASSLEYNNALKELSINNNYMDIQKNPHTLELIVANNVDDLFVTWKSFVEGEKVFYKVYDEGENVDFKEDCCAGSQSMRIDFKSNKKIIEIAVSSTNNPYKVVVNRSTKGWIRHGSPLSNGYNPIYASNTKTDKLYYLTEEGIYQAYFLNGEWNGYDSNVRLGNFNELVSTHMGNKDYLVALPNYTGYINESTIFNMDYNPFVYVVNNNSWYNNVSTSKRGVKSENFRVATSNNQESYVIYEKNTYSVVTKSSESQKDSLRNNRVLASSKITTNSGESFEDFGVVSEFSVNDADIAFGFSNIPFVAYIGATESHKHKESFFVPDDDNLVEDDSLMDNIPGKTYEHYVYDNVVVIKHRGVNDNKWTGYSSIDGDVLTDDSLNLVLNAKKIKLSSDGNNIYMALLCENDNENLELIVYKLSLQNNRLKFTELKDKTFNSSVIALFDKNNHFDLCVYNNTPYLLFENSDNKNNISVLTFNGNNWYSIGAPAFASVSNEKNSATLAMKNEIPYVVFKESEKPYNKSNRGKISAMKYSRESDKDLTIKSLGSDVQNILKIPFRQYILNYKGLAPKNMDTLKLNVSFKTPYDVSGILVELNKNVLLNVNSVSNNQTIKIPLKNSFNEIKIRAKGKGVSDLVYTLNIEKDYTASPEFNLTYYGLDAGVISILSSSSNYHNISSNSVSHVDTLVYGIKPENTFEQNDSSSIKRFCIEFSPLYVAYIQDYFSSTNVCLNYDFTKNEILPINSSSSNVHYGNSSSSNIKSITLVNQKSGDSIVVVLSQEGISSSSNNYSEAYYLSSSYNDSSQYSSSIQTNSSSSIYSNSSSSEQINTSSSSKINYSSSSLKEENDLLPGTSIPNVYQLLLDKKLVALNSIHFENSVSIAPGYYVSKSAQIAAEGKLHGTLMCSNNIDMFSNSHVESIVLGGEYHSQMGATYNSLVQKSVNVPFIPLISFRTNSNNINVWANETKTFAPGVYGDINIYSNANINFEPGTYYFKSLYIAPDVKININNQTKPVQFFVEGNVNLSDRTRFTTKNNSLMFMIYGSSQNDFYVGVESILNATLIYPNGKVNLAPRSNFEGNIWGKSIYIGANATVR